MPGSRKLMKQLYLLDVTFFNINLERIVQFWEQPVGQKLLSLSPAHPRSYWLLLSGISLRFTLICVYCLGRFSYVLIHQVLWLFGVFRLTLIKKALFWCIHLLPAQVNMDSLQYTEHTMERIGGPVTLLSPYFWGAGVEGAGLRRRAGR